MCVSTFKRGIFSTWRWIKSNRQAKLENKKQNQARFTELKTNIFYRFYSQGLVASRTVELETRIKESSLKL